MQIPKINHYRHTISFSSTTRTTYYSDIEGQFTLPGYSRNLKENPSFSNDQSVRMVSSNSTEFFRKDFSWENIGKTFVKRFPKGEVSIYDFGCSDGSEAYSLAIALIEQLGEKKAQRFFPIKASDIDPEIIRIAKSRKINATANDIREIEDNIKNDSICKYFHITQLSGDKFILAPKKILTNNVVFEQKEIKKGLDDIDKNKNNIIMCRNFWKYMSCNDLAKSSWELANKINENSMVIIGSFDCETGGGVPFFLKEMGLKNIKKPNDMGIILEYQDDLRNPDLLESEEKWAKFIRKKHWNYVPVYLKNY